MNHRTIWIIVGVFVAVLLIAGIIHLAFRTSAQLYLNMKATDDKQTEHIFALEKRMTDIEQKQAIFEQNLRYEAQRK
jgi:hypothetical protein